MQVILICKTLSLSLRARIAYFWEVLQFFNLRTAVMSAQTVELQKLSWHEAWCPEKYSREVIQSLGVAHIWPCEDWCFCDSAGMAVHRCRSSETAGTREAPIRQEGRGKTAGAPGRPDAPWKVTLHKTQGWFSWMVFRACSWTEAGWRGVCTGGEAPASLRLSSSTVFSVRPS